jgi:GT2 family glycosyltransferase
VNGLSIVIPSYNSAAMTLETCRAAIAAAPDAEVIVVDDASTDGTFELLRGEVRVVRLDVNRRFGGAANAGVAASRGEIVLLLNSDARVDRDAIAALLDAFASDERLGIAGARLLNPDGTPQWSGGPVPTIPWLVVMVSGTASFLRWRTGASPVRTAEGVCPPYDIGWVSGAAMAFRREAWEPFRETYRFYAQDVEFCVRARSRGWRVRLIEAARVTHIGGATLPQNPALLWLDLLTWGRTHYGRAWAAFARVSMCAAAMLRIAARRVRGLPADVYVAALRQLFVEREEVASEAVGRIAPLDEPPPGVADRTRS